MPARGEKGVVNLVDPTGRIIVNPQRSPGAGSPRSLSFNEIKFNEVAILCCDAVACVKRKLDKISAALRMRLEDASVLVVVGIIITRPIRTSLPNLGSTWLYY